MQQLPLLLRCCWKIIIHASRCSGDNTCSSGSSSSFILFQLDELELELELELESELELVALVLLQ